ncbi:MAG: ATP-binding protein [Acidimicrobiales bacterium]|nr:ATP-binding protein [Acidimicrobiales bacterium]
MSDRRIRFLAGRSVRAQVASLAGVLFALILLLASVALVVTLRQLRLAGVDDNLRLRADDIESLVEEREPLGDPLLAAVNDTVAQIVDADGVVVAASHTAITLDPIALATDGERISESSTVAVDDDRFRILSRSIDDGLVLHVAQSVDDINESQTILVATLSVVGPAVTLLLVAAVWVLVGRTLRPVEAIRGEVEAIGADRLDRRVPVPDGNDEISRLATTMNAMLARVENAHARQREFTADASHELRTPLARMRSELEVDITHPGGADLEATHRSVLEEVDTLQRMIDDLLLLARTEHVTPDRWTLLDLDDLVLHEVRPWRDDAHQITTRVEPVPVRGDEGHLRRAIRNLLDNAARHAGAAIEVELRRDGDRAVVRVSDDGPGIPVADRHRVFERFTRLDAARTAGVGSGLGLAITREIVERHGGSIRIDSGTNGGTVVEIRLPAEAR